MNKFNLTFSGEILAGHDPAQVRLRFARMFAIDDPVRLERFFSGETIILRRNLERKAAAQCYHELHLMGALAALVKVAASERAAASAAPTPKPPANTTGSTGKRTEAKDPVRPARTGASDQTWAVSSAAGKRKVNGKRASTTGAASGSATQGAPQRNTADIAAGIKARKLEAQRQASEQAARERAALAEQERKAAEDVARQQAEAAERQRLAQEDVARQAAEKKRRAEEEAARKLAVREEARRRAAEEERQRQAQRKQRKVEQARRKAEDAARRKAEQEEKKRREAEEDARRKAAQEEKQRQEAIEAARLKAELEEKKRQEAEQAARHKAALEEQKRREAEEAARRQAALEEEKRLEAQAAARQQAELEELQRREAEEEARLQAELAAIKRREAEEAERLRAELEEKAREAAAQAARIKAEAQRQQQEAQRKSEERRRAITEALAARQARQAEKKRGSDAVQAGDVAQQSQPSPPLTPQSTPQSTPQGMPQVTPQPSPSVTSQPAPSATSQQPLRVKERRAKPRIRTALDVPPRTTGQAAQTPAPRKRQPGEPNLYKLRPFRNSDEVRQRTPLARRRARHSYTLGFVALAALLLVTGSFLQRTMSPFVAGARAVAVDPRSGPVLLAQDSLLFHDRAGIGTRVQTLRELGLEALEPPLAFDDSGALLALGRPGAGPGNSADGNALQLLRCEAPLAQCQPFSPHLLDSHVDAFAINPVDGSLLLADRSVGLLLKADREGEIVARAEVEFPEQLVMRLHSGLLLMNSATAPAISVFRYENNAFGKQLDEVLLLPPGAEKAEELRVGDFLWSGETWWVTLYRPASDDTGLYRFDEEWNFLDQVNLPAAAGPLQLIGWGEKILVNDPRQLAIQRVSAQGVVEAPFVSTQLAQVSAAHQRRAQLTDLAWRGALLLSGLGAVLGLVHGYLQSRRALVYQPRREQGAEPLDEHANALQWIDPVANRQGQLQRRMISYAVLALGVLLLAVAQSVGVWQLAALLLALSGPVVALLLLTRRPIGHIGILGDRLLLVDHGGTYHLAGGSRIQYRGSFLSIDDVVVYCGGGLLPAFSPAQVQKQVRPLALGGIKVDRDTLLVKLLQSRHPLALGALAIAAALVAAVIVLSLQGVA